MLTHREDKYSKYTSICAETEYRSYPWGEMFTVIALINLQMF